MVNWVSDSREIYKRLQDEESRYVFQQRLMHSMTGEYSYLKEMVKTTFFPHMQEIFCHQEVLDKLDIIHNTLAGNRVVVYGKGGYGLLYAALFSAGFTDIEIEGFYDKTVQGDFFGYPAISFEQLMDSDSYILITQRNLHLKDNIVAEIVANGIDSGRVVRFDDIDLMQYSSIYFPDFFKLDGDTFVDGGCFDGLTSIDFIDRCPNYKAIVAFEPDSSNRAMVSERFNSCNVRDAEIYSFGLWDNRDTLHFSMGGQGSKVSDDGEIEIEVDSIDNLLFNKMEISFIKMDIEGAEVNAIRGASQIIRRYEPKLAISIYHKPTDIIEIPKVILELVPEYKFYLRHYSPGHYDTVLYAVVEGNK